MGSNRYEYRRSSSSFCHAAGYSVGQQEDGILLEQGPSYSGCVSYAQFTARRGEVNQWGHLGYGGCVRFCATAPDARWWVYVTGFRSPRAEYFGPQKGRSIPGFAQGPDTRENPVTYRRHQIGWDQPR